MEGRTGWKRRGRPRGATKARTAIRDYELIRLRALGWSLREVAARFGISREAARKVGSRAIRHLIQWEVRLLREELPPTPTKPLSATARRRQEGRNRVEARERRNRGIVKEASSGIATKELARRYGLGERSIQKIVASANSSPAS